MSENLGEGTRWLAADRPDGQGLGPTCWIEVSSTVVGVDKDPPTWGTCKQGVIDQARVYRHQRPGG